jgi:hypothetical protein
MCRSINSEQANGDKPMKLSTQQFKYFSRFIGAILTLYGGGALISYVVMIVSGSNGLASFVNEFGVLFLALMGAFALPLGIALFRARVHTEILLKIAGVGLAINGILRLALLLVPEMVDLAGSTTPVVEFVIFSALGMACGFVSMQAIKPVQTELVTQ